MLSCRHLYHSRLFVVSPCSIGQAPTHVHQRAQRFFCGHERFTKDFHWFGRNCDPARRRHRSRQRQGLRLGHCADLHHVCLLDLARLISFPLDHFWLTVLFFLASLSILVTIWQIYRELSHRRWYTVLANRHQGRGILKPCQKNLSLIHI